MQLAAWKDKRLPDMDRDDLVAALQDVWRMYCAANAKRMISSNVPEFRFTMDQAEANQFHICEHGLPQAPRTDLAEANWEPVEIAYSAADATVVSHPVMSERVIFLPEEVEALADGVTVSTSNRQFKLIGGKIHVLVGEAA